MQKKASHTLKLILSVVLAALLLYFAFRGISWKEFLSGLETTSWSYVILSLVTAFAALVLRALRWRQQLKAIDQDAGFQRIWDGSNIGNFLNIIIPGVGEFYRCAYVSHKKSGYDRTFGTIIMERAWDVLAIVCLLAGAILTNTDVLLPFMRKHVMEPFVGRFNFSLWWIIAILSAILAALLICIFAFREKNRVAGKCADAISGALNGFLAFRKIKGKALFLAYTIGIWVMYILMTFLTFKAVPGLQQLSFSDAVFISAVGNIASVIPTPGNLGAYHYLVGLAISNIYLNSSEILAIPLLFATLSHGSHAVLLIIMAIISYIAVEISNTKDKEK